MVAIYLTNVVYDTHGTYGTTSLFRIYDADEVPDDLKARVQNWADTLNERFEMRDLSDPKTPKTIWFSPQQEA